MTVPRNYQWDVYINDVGYMFVRSKGVPEWSVDPVPEVAGKAPALSEEERRYQSWHLGFGYSHFLTPDTYHYCKNMDLRFPRQAIMGPEVQSLTVGGTVNVSDFFEQNGTLFCLAGRYCKAFDLSSITAITVVTIAGGANTGKDFGSSKESTKAENFDGKTVVMMGESENSWVLDTVPAWTQTNTNGIKGTHTTRYYKSDYVLVRSVTSSSKPSIQELAKGNAVDSTAWAAAVNVADADSTYLPITSLAALDKTVFIGRADGVFYNDVSGYTPCILPFGARSTNNAKNMMVDSAGLLWVPSVDGFYMKDTSTGASSDVSPGHGLPNASPIYGRATAQVEYKGWHYAAIYNGTDTYIMVGRRRSEGENGIGPIIWHGALVHVAGSVVDAMHITSLASSPMLFYGVGANAACIILPSNGDNPLLDSSYRYCGSGSIYLPADDWGIPGTRWQPTGFEIDNEGFSSATYADVYMQIDSGGWQFVQRGTSTNKATIAIPATGDWRFGRAAIRLDVTNSSATSTPKIRAIVGKAARRVSIRDLISTRLWCSDYVTNHYGMPTRLSGKEQMQRLKNLGTSAPVTVIDNLTGKDRSRRVLVMPIKERVASFEEAQTAEQAALVDMTVISELPTPAHYGTDTYGSTAQYS